MSRIPQPFIDELIARADIVDVVGSRVSLKKAGRDLKGLCPFHDEKSPSFTVSPTKGFYYCFGCGASGTALTFLMRYDNMSFPEAAETLADMLGLPMPEGVAAPDERREEGGLIPLLHEAEQIYRRALRETPAAIDYLKRRGIDGPTAQRFALGFAPPAWDTLLRALGHDERRLGQLIELGLVIRNEQGRCYDRFRDRIMFPIRNARGDVIGFGGRVLGSGEPKYLNSPESPVFHKGRELYGLFEARRQPGRPERIVVVEGYLDVAGLDQFGLGPAVATLGTSTTADHIRRLTRLADRIVFCFDGDRAGRAAAWRALETALPFAGGNVELKFLFLPDGEDPDSLVRQRGADAFREHLAQAVPLSAFALDELKSRIGGLGGIDGRAKLVALARPLLAKLSPGVYRELFVGELAAAAGLAPERFETLLADARPGGAATPPPAPRAAQRRGRPSLIGKTITLVLHYPAAASIAGPVSGLDELDAPGAPLLRRLLELVGANPDLSTASLIERFRGDPDEPHVVRLAAELPPPIEDDRAAAAELAASLERLVRDHREAEQRRRAVEQLRRLRAGPGNGRDTH